MERAFTPRLVTGPPHSRLAAELSNWQQRPASPQLPDETSCRLGKIVWDYCGVQVPAQRQAVMIHLLIAGRSTSQSSGLAACWHTHNLFAHQSLMYIFVMSLTTDRFSSAAPDDFVTICVHAGGHTA